MLTTHPMNPVWAAYNELRTARLNVKYLQRRLRTLKRVNLSYEIILAIATSSAVTGFSFLQAGAGKAIWSGVGVVAVLLSIIKPILNLPEAFQRKQELLASYMILDHDLNTVCLDIQIRKAFDEALRGQFARALERKAELVKKDTDSSVNEGLRRCCYNEVLLELPADSFYIPPEK